MTPRNTLLLDLIAGRRSVRPAGFAKSAQLRPVPLSQLLRQSLCKRAQAFSGLGEASRQEHRYVKSVANMNAQRQQAAAAAAARRNAPVKGLTGDTDYDNLPDVKRRRAMENAEQAYNRYMGSRQDLVQKKDQATIQKEMGPVKSWGDSQLGRTMVRGISDAFHTAAGLGGSAWLAASRLWDKSRSGTSFMDEQREYWKNHNEARDDVAHDTLNNYQIFANSAANGAGTVARGLNYGVHKVLGASEGTLYSLNNAWDNANAAHKAKMDALQAQFRDKNLSDPNSTFGKINRFAMEQTGRALGETAALGAVGGVAGQIGKGITTGTRALSGAVRGAQAARTAAQAAQVGTRAAQAANAGVQAARTAAQAAQAGTQVAQAANAGVQAAGAGARAASWGARAVQGARNMAARGIDTVGDTVAMPFNAVGSLAHPVDTVRKFGPGVVRDVGQTLNSGVVRPVRGLYGLIRHPMQAVQHVGAHPVQSAWNVASYPVRWAWNTAKPLGRHAFSDTGYKAMAAGGAMRSLASGDYGDAASSLGDMGLYGALGSVYTPYMIGKGIYSGMQGGGGGGGGDAYEGEAPEDYYG